MTVSNFTRILEAIIHINVATNDGHSYKPKLGSMVTIFEYGVLMKLSAH